MVNKSIVLYLHVHQPWRIRDDQTLFDVGANKNYFSEEKGLKRQSNGEIFQKVAEKSYIPMNNLLEKLLKTHPEFKFSFSITGTFIDQAQEFAPEVLESFKRLVQTGRVEIVAETYYHSLAFFFDREEFEAQVRAHQAKIREVFNVETTAFRNTELSYNNELAKWADDFGFKAILAEGWDPILQWRTPNHIYKPEGTKNIRLLLKNYKLSDDLAFRFSNRNWQEYPLTTQKYISWLESSSYHGDVINLFMDYETFGEHQWAESGIFDFFESLVSYWLKKPEHGFKTVTEAAQSEPVAEISMPNTVTWADTERDLTAWLGNSMQQEAMKYLYALKSRVYNSQNGNLVEDWRRLTTSDHPYYMCTKYFNDGDVHAYFSPYKSPYDAFLYFMDTLRDMEFRLKDIPPLKQKNIRKTQKNLQKSLFKTPKNTKRKKIFARMFHRNLMFTKLKRG
ncbi:MAG: glycoside hydrolase family 57 protein [Candidatus Nanogingivalis sp.]